MHNNTELHRGKGNMVDPFHSIQWKSIDINPTLYQTDELLGDSGGLLSLEVYEPNTSSNQCRSTTVSAQNIFQKLQRINDNNNHDSIDEQQSDNENGQEKHIGDNSIDGATVVLDSHDQHKINLCNKRKQRQKLVQQKNKQKLLSSNNKHTSSKPYIPSISNTILKRVESSEWHRLGLHPYIIHSLLQCKFIKPTLIQSQCIPHAALYYKHIVAASATGTGKTLAFILPVLHRYITHTMKLCHNDINTIDMDHIGVTYKHKSIFALIITPTRELALQISEHTNRILSYLPTVIHRLIQPPVTLVGGISSAKQIRLLNYSPGIVIGTPGRLWDMISSINNVDIPFLKSYQNLQFIVFDEIDRLIALNAYPELQHIIQYISKQREGKLHDIQSIDSDTDEQFTAEDTSIRAKIQLYDDNDQPIDMNHHINDDDTPHHHHHNKTKVSKLQLMCFSATLNLNSNQRINSKPNNKKPRHEYDIMNELNEYIVFDSKPQLINLALHDKKHDNTNKHHSSSNLIVAQPNTATPPDSTDSTSLIPNKLQEEKILCTTTNKDYYLYYYLLTHPGKTIIFVNSISCIRRLYSILSILSYPVYQLHASMKQKQRLKFLDRYKSGTNNIIISTDVAARGLDIHDIKYVIHYQLCRTAEIYVHRSGRTARANSDGTSVALISESDQLMLHKLTSLHNRTIHDVHIDSHIFNQCVQRINLTKQIDQLQHSISHRQHSKQWRNKQSTELELVIDSDASDTDELVNEQQHTNKQTDMKIHVLKQQLSAMLQQQVHPAMKRKFHTADDHQQLNQQLQIEFKFN